MASVHDIGVPGQPATNLTAWQAAVRDTVIQRFANAAARTTAIPAPAEGQQTWLQDVKRMEVRVGGAWVTVLPNAIRGTAVNAAVNNAPAGFSRINAWGAPTLEGGMTFVNGAFVVPVSGMYLMTATVFRTAGGAGAWIAGVDVGDVTALIKQGPTGSVPSAGAFMQGLSDTIGRSAGETVGLWIYSSVANIPVGSGGQFTLTLINT